MAVPLIFFFTGSAGSVVSSVGVTTAGAYTVAVAWNPASFTNITQDVVHLNISRPLWTLFDSVTPGEMQIEVLNIRGKYTPDNVASPFAGLIKNGREAKVFVQVQSGTSIQLFQGFLDQISLPANDVEGGRVTMSFRDRAREFRHRTINTSLWVDYNISSLYENVLTAAGINKVIQSINRMPDQANLTWFRDVTADSALTDMISFNFSKGFVSRTGVVTFLDRYYDQDTTGVQSYNQFLSLDYSLTDDAVINDARFESDPRRASTTVSCLSYITKPIPIPAFSSVSFVTEYLDPQTRRSVPAVNMIQPVSGTDYHAGTSEGFGDTIPGAGPIGPLAGTTDNATTTTSAYVQFFGETAVSSVYNGLGQTVYLNKYVLRGQHLPEAPKVQAITISSSSQAVYGKRSFFLSSSLLGNREYLQDYGTFLVDRQKDSIPGIRAVIRNQINSASISAEPGALVSISNSNTAVGSLHFIKRLEHDIDMSLGVQHTISMDLERVVKYKIWKLGHPTLGALDAGNILGF